MEARTKSFDTATLKRHTRSSMINLIDWEVVVTVLEQNDKYYSIGVTHLKRAWHACQAQIFIYLFDFPTLDEQYSKIDLLVKHNYLIRNCLMKLYKTRMKIMGAECCIWTLENSFESQVWHNFWVYIRENYWGFPCKWGWRFGGEPDALWEKLFKKIISLR